MDNSYQFVVNRWLIFSLNDGSLFVKYFLHPSKFWALYISAMNHVKDKYYKAFNCPYLVLRELVGSVSMKKLIGLYSSHPQVLLFICHLDSF